MAALMAMLILAPTALGQDDPEVVPDDPKVVPGDGPYDDISLTYSPELYYQEVGQEADPSGDVYQPVDVNNWGDYVTQYVSPVLDAVTDSFLGTALDMYSE
jgi:hypothetical protein